MAQDGKKLAYWKGHIKGWQSSGLSQRLYCDREGLALSSFDRWQRLIRKERDIKAEPTAGQGKLTLVPVQVSRAAEISADILLRSPAGWQVSLPATWALEQLAQLFSRLP